MDKPEHTSSPGTPIPEAGPVLVWFRRDLRLDDNPALIAGLQSGRPVIPVFIWAPEEEGQFQQGRYSRWWSKQTVTLFSRLIEQMGSRLIIRRASETRRGLMQLVNETNAKAVYFNHLYDPISLVRDHEVKAALNKLGIQCKSFNADLLYEPWEVLDINSQPFTTYAAFWSKVLEMPTPPPFPLQAPAQLPGLDPDLFSLPVNEVDWFFTPEQEASSEQLKFKWKPGVEGAVEKLEAFLLGQLPQFEHDRAKVDRSSTSQLSPWIHTGTISVRYIFYRVCQRQAELRLAGSDISESCKDFLQQLGYREYSRYLSFHFPFIHERSLLAHLRACPWRMDQQHFKAWRQGQTGYPLVDAAMRELWSTGWCHNRMRVVASSFMVKNLLLPWQWGLKHFWDAQMDADLECDALGWQYVSGGMTDAHPFDYIIDLEQEAKRFDPDGEYVRRWLPVLSRLPTKYIHAPWKAPPEVLLVADVELGFNYPDRVLTLEESKKNMEYACRVLESCASNSCGPATSHPYRPPTQPVTSNKDGATNNYASKPSKGTGTHTQYQGDKEQASRALGVATEREDGNAVKNTSADVVQGWAGAAAAGVKNVETGPYARQAGAAAVRERASAYNGANRGSARVNVAATNKAAHHMRYAGKPAKRQHIEVPPGWKLVRAGGNASGQDQEDPESDVDEDAHGDASQAPTPEIGDALSASASEGSASDDAMSEEVVSNTIGLSAPQVTGMSVYGVDGVDFSSRVRRAVRAEHPVRSEVASQGVPEAGVAPTNSRMAYEGANGLPPQHVHDEADQVMADAASPQHPQQEPGCEPGQDGEFQQQLQHQLQRYVSGGVRTYNHVNAGSGSGSDSPAGGKYPPQPQTQDKGASPGDAGDMRRRNNLAIKHLRHVMQDVMDSASPTSTRNFLGAGSGSGGRMHGGSGSGSAHGNMVSKEQQVHQSRLH